MLIIKHNGYVIRIPCDNFIMMVLPLRPLFGSSHYNDVIMNERLKSPTSRLFTQSFIQTQIKENIKAPRHWPLCGEFTGDGWIPRTNGQLRGKCFLLMTSSCTPNLHGSVHAPWTAKRVQVAYLGVSGLILGLRPANGRRRYFLTTYLTGWPQT